ncbi:hypothetical protein ACFQET_06990 [Levilactobacillus tangyuanensis]|uniref:Uncharacterized protein n=1 Tax=Levilactobacillus tangyuanensis TaxID=2486021 RepID=A0ABW1TR59_9LACO|nr:hypothetical protein [Levilactobacillus tangyuanensis]
MSKQRKLWVLLDLVFLIAFNIVFFVLGGANGTAAIWWAYGFIHLAYILLLVTPYMVRKNSSSTALFNMSLYSISMTYFLITFVCGLIFIFRYPQMGSLSLVSQVIITGLYAIILIAHIIANDRTADALVVHEQELQFVKVSSGKLAGILARTQDAGLKKKVEQAYDLAHASQVKSSTAAQMTEHAVLAAIDELDRATAVRDQKEMAILLDRIINGIENRNRQLQFTQ